jgi:hypothetical protein
VDETKRHASETYAAGSAPVSGSSLVRDAYIVLVLVLASISITFRLTLLSVTWTGIRLSSRCSSGDGSGGDT